MCKEVPLGIVNTEMCGLFQETRALFVLLLNFLKKIIFHCLYINESQKVCFFCNSGELIL